VDTNFQLGLSRLVWRVISIALVIGIFFFGSGHGITIIVMVVSVVKVFLWTIEVTIEEKNRFLINKFMKAIIKNRYVGEIDDDYIRTRYDLGYAQATHLWTAVARGEPIFWFLVEFAQAAKELFF
jgi:hypothetical protein